ncbi:MAG TPA: hypothetical protein VF683_11405 [Chthoniobacterales bacterium]
MWRKAALRALLRCASARGPEYQAAQAELVSGHIAKQDIVITTARLDRVAAGVRS